MDTLVVVRTPLQLLNAIEAKAHFNLSNCVLVILISRQIDMKYFSSVVSESDWEQILYYDPSRRWLWPVSNSRKSLGKLNGFLSQWKTRLRFDGFFERFRNVKNLVLGCYGQVHFVHIANILPTASCIIVDDGTDSLQIARERLSKARIMENASKEATGMAWRVKQIVTKHVHWMTQQRTALTFFSSYTLELPRQDRVVKNSFAVARKKAGSQRLGARCIFLGQPLVEDRYLERGEFESLLFAIKIQLSPETMVYVPHPREVKPLLQGSLVKLGIDMQPLDTSIEYFLIASDTLPKVVASFFSSALDNCRAIWGGRMRLVAFRIPENSLIQQQEQLDEIYGYFEKTSQGEIEIKTISTLRTS